MRCAGAAAAILTLSLVLSPGARADAYMLLDRNVDAAQVRVDLIRSARHTIDTTYFIVGEDEVALSFLAELRQASRRGVTVRLIVDAPFNAIPLPVRAALRREGVEVQEYHPFRLTKPHWFGRRLHDKLLIVDGIHLVTGGRNLEASYFGLRDQEDPDAKEYVYIDRDAYVRGEAAASAKAYFDRVWTSREVRRVKLGRFRPRSYERDCENQRRCLERKARLTAEVDQGAAELDERFRALEADGVLRRDVMEPLTFDAREVGQVTFLHDPVGRRAGEDGISTALFALLDGTEESIVLESPWLVPSRALRKSFRHARERGVEIRVLTNSLATTDSLLTYAGYLRYRKRLSRQGIELWEFAGPGCLHSKTGVLDAKLVIVGSFNLDPRSEHFNSEVAIVLEDGRAAAEASAPMDARLGHAIRIDGDGKPVPGAVQLPPTPFKRRLLLAVARLVAVFVHRQL